MENTKKRELCVLLDDWCEDPDKCQECELYLAMLEILKEEYPN